MNNLIYTGVSTNPYHNLAVEELLFETYTGNIIFYLWQNQNTVVIGKHQNAWKECRIKALEEDGGTIVRRLSGGGAVYHDLGNLNFTFILPSSIYNVQRQLSVIQRAVGQFGIKTSFTGRNDLVISETGAKFSGNAFRFSQSTGMHHGTLLINADLQKMGKYLLPSDRKLKSKGIDSVRSRVSNLNELNPSITIEAVKKALHQAFIDEYGEAVILGSQDLDPHHLADLTEKYASWEWRFGQTPHFDIVLEERFEWGEVALYFALSNGIITNAKVYSDAMDEALISQIAPTLTGCPFDNAQLCSALLSLQNHMAEDIALWISELSI